jgi:mannose-1-phosphate guanylyltransferase / mannose-6-phosphate isomerase
MNLPVIPVILCGGSSTRPWPLSRESYPKQFLPLLGEKSLLQQTMERLDGGDGIDAAILVCHESSRFLMAEQLREIGIEDACLMLEPMRRSTAPAIAAAALQALSNQGDALLLALPSDHVIKDRAAFYAAVKIAKHAAMGGDLVTFGIHADRPEAGYGYIRTGRSLPGEAQPVLEFIATPDRDTAEQYIASGNYCWNSGMFMFRASTYLEELARFEPNIVSACREAVEQAKTDFSFVWLDRDSYAATPERTIEHAVMERTERASMVALDTGWRDIGSWSSGWEFTEKDIDNNAMQGDVLLQDCEGCMVHGTSRLVAVVGLKDAVIVDSPDALLVMAAERTQETRNLVEKLVDARRVEALQHREVFCPWGSYDSIGGGKRFQVKRITVKQGARLSLQMHHHRAEHWVVVSGTAKITNGNQEYLLTENQSTYIPVGAVHSLENPGKIPLELIEIQSGSYLGEDDIVPLQDLYGRA